MNVNYPSGGIASLLSSQGRNGDSMLIHMAPEEVQGLQSLAMAAGGSLSINPETGLYEASFLKKLLPTLLGIGLSFIPGVGPLAAAGLVGAGETIRTGDLGKGLMAGLGAYGGAGLGSAISGVGSVATSAAGTPGIANMTPEAFKTALNKQAVSTASDQAIKQGVTKAGLTSGLEALKTAPLTSLKAVGTQLGTTGIGGLGVTAANAMTPEYKPPKGSEEETMYYISKGYDPEKGFLGGEYVKQYPGLPGYAEGGDVAPQPQQQDLKSYYQSLLAAPQQAPQQNAALQQYMTDLNKFVATSGPTAPKTSPTYVAPPPPPPKEEPKKDEPKKDEPKRDNPRMPGFDRDIDWDTLSQFNINREDVENALRNYNAGNMGMGQAQNQNVNTTRMGGVANPFVEGFTPDFNMMDYTQLPGYGGNTGMDIGAQSGIGNMPTGNLYMDGMMDTTSITPGIQDYGSQNYMENFGEFNNMYSGGGSLGGYSDGGRMLRGPGDGMSDNIPAEIRGRKGRQPARLADGEFVVPADVVSHLGNGSSEAGSRKLYKMMDNIRKARTGRTKQAPAVKAERYLPRK